MSFVTPKEYKAISEDLGDAFVLIRDAVNNAGSTGDAFEKVQSAALEIANATDNDIRVSQVIDPVLSIMNDLGTTWETGTNRNFSQSNASIIASNLFGSMLRRLNDHVKNRTLNPSTSSKHSTVQAWFGTYAFTSGKEEYSLFWNGGSAPDGSGSDGSGGSGAYFSQNFEDLCTALNITIPSAYKQSTYSS